MLARLALVSALLLACSRLSAEEPAAPAPAPAPPPAPAADAPPADGQPPVTSESGLVTSVLRAGGSGRRPKMGDTVRILYRAWVAADGTLFDDARKRGKPVEVPFASLIPGLQEALAQMTPGAHWKVTVPAAAAFGKQGRRDVPPDAALVVELELLGVRHQLAYVKVDAAKATSTPSGMRYEVLAEGEGELLTDVAVVELDYAFWGPDGRLIQDAGTGGGALTAVVGDLPLPGLKEAARLMKRGTRLRLELPPALGFGDKPQGALPGGSVTTWEVEVLSVKQPLPLPAFQRTEAGKGRRLPSGLLIETLVEGTGRSPKMNEKVTVHYAGWLEKDGSLFDSSYARAEPTTFVLGRVIKGWNEGLQEMKVGATARLTIPAALAYGVMGSPPKIGPNEPLVFVVELLKVGD